MSDGKKEYAANVVAAKLYGMVGSPVEMVLGTALFEKLSGFYQEWWCRIYSDIEFRGLANSPGINGRSVIGIVPQMKIDGIGFVDFGVCLPAIDTTDPIVIVECDGHDFHEKTPEQASKDKRRDRALIAKGIPVLRYTGADILREAASAATEVAELYDTQASRLEADWFRTIGDKLNNEHDGPKGMYVPYQWPRVRLDGKHKQQK